LWTRARKKLAALFRRDHESEGDINNTVPNVYPFFIGVFDTVAALADPASLLILSVVYLVLHSLVAWGLSTQLLALVRVDCRCDNSNPGRFLCLYAFKVLLSPEGLLVLGRHPFNGPPAEIL
jgi:hypothetical protein